MSRQDGVSCAKRVALTCWPFEITPLDEFHRGASAINTSYTLWDILMIFGIHVYQAKTACRVQEWLLSLAGLLKYLP